MSFSLIPPAERTRFVGRMSELAALRDALAAGGRLLTVVGPPGIGKSRLLSRAAKALSEERETQALRVDLADAEDLPALLAVAWRALGIAEAGADAPPQALKRIQNVLRARGFGLVVLDHAEASLEAARSFARAMSEGEGTITLVGSREPLALDAERRFDLGPLAPEEAAQLFADRLARLDRDLSAAEIGEMGSLIDAIGGTPLGIELGVARLELASVQEVLREAKEQGDAREAGVRGSIDTTIRVAVARSMRGLPEETRALLHSLAVFRGGFRRDAVEATAGAGRASIAAEALATLRRRSLLHGEPEPAPLDGLRFRLYDVVRECVLREAEEAGLLDAQRVKHAAYVRELAARWSRGIGQADGRRMPIEMRLERENVRAAFAFLIEREPPAAVELALSLAWPLRAIGEPTLRRELLSRASRSPAAHGHERPEDGSRSLRFAAAHARLLIDDDAAEEALALARRALESTRPDAASIDLAHLRLVCAHAALRCGDAAMAKALVADEEVRALARTQVQVAYELWSLAYNLGIMSGDFAARREHAARLVAAAVAHGDELLAAFGRSLLGACDLELGDLGAARANFDAAFEAPRAHGLERSVLVIQAYLGRVMIDFELGALEAATETLATIAALREETGYSRMLVADSRIAAEVALARGDVAAAKEAAARARRLWPQAEDVWGLDDRAIVAVAHAHDGDADEVITELEAIDRALAALPGPPLTAPSPRASGWMHVAYAYIVLGMRAVSTGDLSTAQARLGDAEKALLAGLGSIRADESTIGKAPMGARVTYHIVASRVAALRASLRARATGAPIWRVSADGKEVIDPSGVAVDLSHRPTLARVVVLLARTRVAQPGASLAVTKIASTVWAGERIVAKAAASRVHVAVATLRKMGLQALILRNDEGYYLDPTREVVFV